MHRHLLVLCALAACMTGSGRLQAQPVAVGAVTPPARVDTALRGSVLASMRAGSPAACLAECQRTPGCTGYNFAAPGPGPVLPGSPGGKLGASVDPRAANCTLMSGALADAPNRGVVSCRMPCTPELARIATTPQALPGAMVREPRPALPMRQHPAASAPVAAALLVAPTPVILGSIVPPTASTGVAPAPPPRPSTGVAPAPPPRPAAPAAVVRSGVSGYEVVAGPLVNIAPLSHSVTSAQCPAGKVALSAGYRVTAPGDARFGLEVRGAMPDGGLATVLVRNANVFEPAKAQALAVCVNAIAGLRVLEVGRTPIDNEAVRQFECNATERLVGGGVMGSNDVLLGANAPRRPSFDDPLVFGTSGVASANGSPVGALGSAMPSRDAKAVWRSHVVASSAISFQVNSSFSARALCAPEAAVDGWELVDTADVELGARSQVAPAVSCPGEKVLLAAGVAQGSSNRLDMVVAAMAPKPNTLGWEAQIANRNTIGGGGAVRAGLSAICARRQ